MTPPNNDTSSRKLEETVTARPVTQSELAYRNGYVNGRAVENHVQNSADDERRIRDTNNTAWGLLLGILLTSVAGLAIGSLFFFDYANRNPAPSTPTVVPVPDRDTPVTAPSPVPQTQRDTTVIERNNIQRTQEIVPVPQPVAPSPSGDITTPPNSNSGVTQPIPNQSPSSTPITPNTTGTPNTSDFNYNYPLGNPSDSTTPGTLNNNINPTNPSVQTDTAPVPSSSTSP